MDATSFADFVVAMGEEFATALRPPVDAAAPQDGYEVWLRAFGTAPSPAALAALTAPEIEQLRAAAASYFECPNVSANQVSLAVDRTLARLPAQPD